MNHHRRAVTRVEILVLTSVCAVATSLLIGLSATGSGYSHAPAIVQDETQPIADAQQAMAQKKDLTQMRILHQAMVVFAQSANGQFPRPGMIHRMPVTLHDGTRHSLPGRGEEDVSRNTTANLYSAMIAQNYVAAKDVIGTTEPNELVTLDENYNYSAYNPAGPDVAYWDSTFTGNLETGSNASYAHTPIVGKRAKREWRSTLSAAHATIGHRGPRNGAGPDALDYVRSNTLKIYGDPKVWAGGICFNDNHVEVHDTFTPEALNIRTPDGILKDNIFRADVTDESVSYVDTWLTFTTAIHVDDDGAARATIQHD